LIASSTSISQHAITDGSSAHSSGWRPRPWVSSSARLAIIASETAASQPSTLERR